MPLLKEAGEVTLAVIALTVLLMTARYITLLRRARSPRVQVSSVSLATSEASEGEVDPLWVKSLLREQLTALRLSATDALPEAPPGPPLVEIVEGIGEGIGDKSTLGRALGRLFRAIFPEAAYEVSATLRPSSSAKTISVQVVDRTRRNRTLVSAVHADTDWKECARAAAAAVAGSLYPRVGDKHKGPWTQWKEPVPGELVALNDDARRHEEKNRLEQALGTYHEALQCDPLNPHLRLRIAMLQERLELDLAAWATYRAIADETHRDAWKGADRRVRLVAQYRLAVLLGKQRVASRWVYGAQDPGEKRYRKELRDALATDRHMTRGSWWNRSSFLAKKFPVRFITTSSARLLDDFDRPKARLRDVFTAIAEVRANRGDWVSKQLCVREDDENGAAAMRRITDLLEIVSLARLEQLDTQLRRKPPWRPWRWVDWWRYRLPLRRRLGRRELSLSAIRVSKLIARVRIVSSAERRLTKEIEAREKAANIEAGAMAADVEARARATDARERLLRRWPFKASGWRRPARWLRPRHRVADRRDDSWQYHYNAACAVSRALPKELKPEASTRTPDDSDLVEAGLKQLEEYVHRAGGEQVRAQADWVGREDDDLGALRATEEYKRWAGHHLPTKLAKAGMLDTARIAARIAHGSARAFAESWKERVEHPKPDADLVAIWWRKEEEAWEALGGIFKGHRSWRKRWEGIAALQRCLRAGGELEPIDAGHRPEDRQAAGDLSNRLLQLLSELAAMDPLPRSSEVSVSLWAQRRADKAHAALEQRGAVGYPTLRSQLERREAQRALRIWTRLGDALETELNDHGNGAPGEELRACLAGIKSEVSQQSENGWNSRSRQIASEAIEVVRGK